MLSPYTPQLQIKVGLFPNFELLWEPLELAYSQKSGVFRDRLDVLFAKLQIFGLLRQTLLPQKRNWKITFSPKFNNTLEKEPFLG